LVDDPHFDALLHKHRVRSYLAAVVNDPRWLDDDTTMMWRAEAIKALNQVIAEETEKQRIAELRKLLSRPEEEVEGESK